MAEQLEFGIGHTVGSTVTQTQFEDILKNLQRKAGTIQRNMQDDLESSYGLFAIDSNGDPVSRVLTAASAELVITNAAGIAGNPSIGLGTAQLIREHVDTDWENVTSDGATLTPGKHIHFLKFTGGASNDVMLTAPPTGGKVCRKILINNGATNVTVNELNFDVFAAAASIVLGPGDAIMLYSDTSIKWHIGSTHFLGGADITAGTLVIGNRYEIVHWKTDTASGDDFSNVGAATNETSVIFTATAATPTVWSGLSILRDLGAGVINV